MADFTELLKILRRETPSRPVLFELFMNEKLYAAACGDKYDDSSYYSHMCSVTRAFEILDDLFKLGYDGRHSYEDNIMPVEQAYDVLIDHMAVLGGIDMDFLVRSSPEAVAARAKALLAKTGSRGYALGSGNTIPEYVPFEQYFAMIGAAKIKKNQSS